MLEQAGLVTRTRDAQRRPVHLNAAQLEALTAWIDRYRLTHEQQFRSHTPDDGSFAFHGVFHVVRENEFAIQTFEFEGFPDVVSIESIAFEDLGGASIRIRVHAVYPTLEARDGMVASGMEHGVREGFERLDELMANA